jgi:phage terminase large subunit-like protein
MQSVIARYKQLMLSLEQLTERERLLATRKLVRTDLYFLLRYAMGRKDVEHAWLLDRIRDVQEQPDGYIDLWARGHYKSTTITYAKTIQDILASHGDDPLPHWQGIEPTFGIFSCTRPIAKAFLRQIKVEFETNETLKALFPDVLYAKPDAQSPRWSEDNGLVVKRKSNPKEATIEAWGLVDGQPTSKHFNVLIYDDVVTRESVSNPDMIHKTTDAWELSLNLGDRNPRKRIIGTRYSFSDTYKAIMDKGEARQRIFPATHDGTLTGKPVFLTRDELDRKIREMGPYNASAQLLLNPTHDSKQSFKREWLRFYEHADNFKSMNRALLCDPANEKKRTSDYTTMAVVAKGPDNNLYILDMIRDRLNLQERAATFILMHRKWKPQRSGYEKYGKDADISYIKEIQGRENYRFDIEELGGKLSKVDRVNRLIPIASENRLYLPVTLPRTNYEGKTLDLVNVLIEEEMTPWPVPVHDDLLDAITRIFDIEMAWPKSAEIPKADRYSRDRSNASWMGA